MQDPASAWRPLRRLRTHEQVLAAIEEQIVRGTLRAGDRLPSERDLAEMLGVSRPSVREALRVLEWMGVVVAGVGSGKDAGSIISGQPREALARLVGMHLALAHFSLEDVVHTRVALEVAAVREAAAKGTGEDIAALRAILARMQDPGLEPHEFNELDTDFHVRIASASGNDLLRELMHALRDAVRQAMVEVFERLPDWRAKTRDLHADHSRILDAIAAHDADAAATAVLQHIHDFYATMVQPTR